MQYLIAILFLIGCILSSCSNSSQNETSAAQDSAANMVVESQADMKRNYLPIDPDTAVVEKEISLDNVAYRLKIIQYSLRDSAVTQTIQLTTDGPEELLVAHNYTGRIILTKGNKVIFDKPVSKEMFRRSWDGGYQRYDHARLYDIQYSYAHGDQLYFEATLISPDSFGVDEDHFAFFYRTEKTGQFSASDEDPRRTNYDHLSVYVLKRNEMSESEKLGFVSVLDSYPDTLGTPVLHDDVETKLNDKYLVMEPNHREKFLKALRIPETDKLFIYNYRMDTLITLAVNQLKLVAFLNPYSGGEGPFSQDEYMIGFEIDKSLMKLFGDYYYDAFVYVGKESPFAHGQLKPFKWSEIDAADFPAIPLSPKDNLLMKREKYAKRKAYKFVTTDFEYFVQEFSGQEYTEARRLLVIDAHSGVIVWDWLCRPSEGSSPAPLNYINDETYVEQWTGKLFKDAPPVVLGFEYVSFGCPSITILDNPISWTEIKCDNWH